jgi:hypothetical protein
MGNPRSYAAVLSGAIWTQVGTPQVPVGSVLSGVACAANAECVAAGYAGSPSVALGETYDGTQWSVASLQTPTTGTESSLADVSCANPRWCLAGGRTAGPTSSALLEEYDGTQWNLVAAPTSGGSGISAVSCPTRTFCVAVGIDSDGGMVAVGTA